MSRKDNWMYFLPDVRFCRGKPLVSRKDHSFPHSQSLSVFFLVVLCLSLLQHNFLTLLLALSQCFCSSDKDNSTMFPNGFMMLLGEEPFSYSKSRDLVFARQ